MPLWTLGKCDEHFFTFYNGYVTIPKTKNEQKDSIFNFYTISFYF